MAAGDEEPWPPPRLPELWEAGQRLLDEVDAASEPTGSRAVQAKVRRGLRLLRRAADMLARLDPFGPREALDEMASADLKYLALPALQGALALKQVGPAPRREHLQRARAHFLDYLARCRAHGVADDFELPGPAPGPVSMSVSRPRPEPGLLALATQRQAKIERYRLRTEVQARLSALQAAVRSGRADDELVREYHLLQLRRWVGISLDEIEGIDQELRILQGDDAAAQGAPASPPMPPTGPPLKPFILTRDQTQARVFGAGYPSLATMTVNEWYEQHQQQHGFGAGPHHVAEPPCQSAGASRAPKEEDDEEDEEDKDEERTRRRAQEWDDWKDTHPKGYGNRQNMG